MSDKPFFLTRRGVLTASAAAAIAVASVILGGRAISAQDKYTVQVPGGLAFSEFRGYEAWQVVSISEDGPLIAAILANPVMIDAYMAGVPGNGQPFPDGSKMAKIHWAPKKMEMFPIATVPGPQHDMDFMVKDSKRFADSGGWGYAMFEYDAASDTFRPGTLDDKPPQGTTPSAGSCATRSRRQEITFFTITSTGEAKPTKSAPRRAVSSLDACQIDVMAPRAAQQHRGDLRNSPQTETEILR